MLPAQRLYIRYLLVATDVLNAFDVVYENGMPVFVLLLVGEILL